MKNYILIGNPVKHSISPIIHNTFFDEMKIDNKSYDTYLIENLSKKDIDLFFFNKIQGLNVTVPYKIDIMKYLYKIDEKAKIIGSVNTLKYTEKGYIGYNTDIDGMEDSFALNDINIQNKTILILGAGGSGYTAGFMCLKNKAKKLIIVNRTLENANKLKKHILNYYKDAFLDVISLEEIDNIKNIDIIINTTTLGFEKNIDKTLINNAFFKNNDIEFVLDIIYTPLETKLLKIAKENNVKCTNGFDMLIYQALKAQEIWQDIVINKDFKLSFKEKMYKKYLSLL